MLDVSRTFTSLPLTMSSGLLKFDIQIITQILIYTTIIQTIIQTIPYISIEKRKRGASMCLKIYFKLSNLPLNNLCHLAEEVLVGVVAVPMDIVVFEGESQVFMH